MVRTDGQLVIALASLLAACTAEAPASEVGTPSPPAAATAEIEAPSTLPCPSPDVNRACEADTADAAGEFERALAGDYQAQRNTAYLFARSDYILARPIQACAWRLVIGATRPADGSPTDESEVHIDCDRLSERDRAEADRVANLIHRRIHGSDLPVAP